MKPRSDDPLSNDPEIHANAWASLAPKGPALADRREELADVCRTLMRKGRSPDEMFLLWMIVRAYVDESRSTPPSAQSETRQLAKDAEAVVPQLKRALVELVRIHKNAAALSPFMLPDAKRSDGQLWWADCRRKYDDALKALDIDPALTYLSAFMSRDAAAGNPTKRRNGRLRRELKMNGLNREQITTILQALCFLPG